MFTICTRTRGATTLFRRKIPLDLKGRFAISEIVRSLGRASVGERRRLAGALWQETEVLFMTVRNQPAMTIDDISRLTTRIGSEFILDNMFVLPTKGGNPAEINTQAGRAAFLRGVAAAVAADQRREGTISDALVERELEREGISLPLEHQALLRDISASDLVRRVHETADRLHRAPMKAEQHADPGDNELRRAINLLRKAKVGEFLSDFVDPDVILRSGNSEASPGPAGSQIGGHTSESLVALSHNTDPGLKVDLSRSAPMPASLDADHPATWS